MAAPRSLTGAPTTITVDGVDLHVYGVTITSVDNPLPAAIESTINALGLDGAIDFTKNYGTRQMSVTGEITADNHAALLVYIDELTKLFRLRENGEMIKVIFSDQPDRYWSCRYSGFSPKLKTLKNYGRTAAFQLNFVCVKPYAEATSITSAKIRLNMKKDVVFDYPGTIKTPINFNITEDVNDNILDFVTSKVSSEDPTAWTYSNATGSTSATKMYGSYSVNTTRVSAGSYYAEINVSTEITNDKSYVVEGYTLKNSESVSLQVISNEGIIKTATFTGSTGAFNFAQIKLIPSDLTGKTGIKVRIYCAGTTNASFLIDGMLMYEASDIDTDFNTSAYVSPPYLTLGMIATSRPKIVMVAGKNLFPCNNGELAWSDTGVDICNDPIGNEQCTMYYSEDNNSNMSLLIPITQNKTYKLTTSVLLDTIGPVGEGFGFTLLILFYTETLDLVETGAANGFSYTTPSVSWVNSQIRVTAPSGTLYARVLISSSDLNACKVYIKNISIEEEIVSGDAFNSYTPYNKTEQTFLGDVSGYNELNFNNDKLTSRFNSFDLKSSVNAMQYFSGDKIELMPGINTLRYYDARYGAAHPETASRGTCFCMYSYRARYL